MTATTQGKVKRGLNLVAALALMALAACGSGKVDFDRADLETPTLLVERLPIAVGVHYDDELLNHYHQEVWYGGLYDNEYRLGAPTAALFDPIFSQMFETVVPVESPSTATVDGQKISGVLSLTIQSFVAPNIPESGGDSPPINARINYSVTLYAPPGVTKTVLSLHGEGASESISEVYSDWVARAMRNAAASLVVSFYEDPEVVAWLASLDTSEEGAEETSQ